ncbi:MAG: iron-sulfur cluster repair di-iron protein [Mangrovimonas sp.]|nr:iron-sulfur cluster repair di-iron protein [Mangrovimonas sp.]MCB0465782.1 iron-sulfur cluster repair di-iron protein [Aequorivita sp.]
MERTIDPKEKNIGQFVAEDYRTAAIFKKHNIDFCCKGHKTLKEVCEKRGLKQDEILYELETVLNSNSSQSIDYKSWPLDLLIDYIEKKHHRYVEEKTPVLKQFLDKLCKVHGQRHPELFEVNELFIASAVELAAHMKKEELILFPFIKKLFRVKLDPQMVFHTSFVGLENPIAMMMNEHDKEGERFRQIAKLTNDYQAPVDACNTYRATYAMLEEFEKDLHLHIHLENNILFPKAIKLEKQFEI